MPSKELEESRMFQRNGTYDAKKSVGDNHPIIEEISGLKFDRYPVVRMAKKYERKLIKSDQLHIYNEVLQPYSDRVVRAPVSAQDMQDGKKQAPTSLSSLVEGLLRWIVYTIEVVGTSL